MIIREDRAADIAELKVAEKTAYSDTHVHRLQVTPAPKPDVNDRKQVGEGRLINRPVAGKLIEIRTYCPNVVGV